MLRRSLLLLLLALGCSSASAAERQLTVFAAASLTNVMEDIGRAWSAQSSIPVRFSFAASSALARQIESGAPADVFMSADQEWMDYLAQRQLIAAATRSDIVSNRLVLVAPVQSKIQLRIARGFDLAGALGANGRLATGDPASVPVGRYAQAALTWLGVWQGIEPRLIPADNVRTALNFVARGEAPLGIVYATDALVEKNVRVVDIFPAESHAAITYPAAATATAAPPASDFLGFLSGPAAQAIFDKAGFGKP